jgi:hypothetical protein
MKISRNPFFASAVEQSQNINMKFQVCFYACFCVFDVVKHTKKISFEMAVTFAKLDAAGLTLKDKRESLPKLFFNIYEGPGAR